MGANWELKAWFVGDEEKFIRVDTAILPSKRDISSDRFGMCIGVLQLV